MPINDVNVRETAKVVNRFDPSEMYAAASVIPTDILLEVLRDRFRTLEDRVSEIADIMEGFRKE